jgi:hypothetical protein
MLEHRQFRTTKLLARFCGGTDGAVVFNQQPAFREQSYFCHVAFGATQLAQTGDLVFEFVATGIEFPLVVIRYARIALIDKLIEAFFAESASDDVDEFEAHL